MYHNALFWALALFRQFFFSLFLVSWTPLHYTPLSYDFFHGPSHPVLSWGVLSESNLDIQLPSVLYCPVFDGLLCTFVSYPIYQNFVCPNLPQPILKTHCPLYLFVFFAGVLVHFSNYIVLKCTDLYCRDLYETFFVCPILSWVFCTDLYCTLCFINSPNPKVMNTGICCAMFSNALMFCSVCFCGVVPSLAASPPHWHLPCSVAALYFAVWNSSFEWLCFSRLFPTKKPLR